MVVFKADQVNVFGIVEPRAHSGLLVDESKHAARWARE